MSRRSSSTNRIDSGISREIGKDLAQVKLVAANIDAIIKAASVDLVSLTAALEKATDFEGITVVSGQVASWDADTKVLTVPTVKGDTGDKGQDLKLVRITPKPAGTFEWEFSDGTIYTTPSLRGNKGDKGDKGDKGESVSVDSIVYQGNGVSLWRFSDGTTYQTPDMRGAPGPKGSKGDKGDEGAALSLVSITHQGEGKFLWTFSDGSDYITPSLLGPRGKQGLKGDRGLQGVSVHHLRRTNTTEPGGNYGTFGERDTYTFYGDPDETIVLGWFSVMNGISTTDEIKTMGVMLRETYDSNGNGLVNDSEKLEGNSLQDVHDYVDNAISAAGTIFIVSDQAEYELLFPSLTVGDIVYVSTAQDGWEERIITGSTITDFTVSISEKTHSFIGIDTPLNTTSKTITGAINELLVQADSLKAEVGNTENLDTTASDLTNGVNELLSKINNLKQEVGDSQDLDTLATDLATAVNEVLSSLNSLVSKVGDTAILNTVSKTVVPAINEVLTSQLNESTRLGDLVSGLSLNKYDKTGGHISGSISVSGDLSVAGTMNTVNAVTVEVDDNTIVLNKGEAGAGVTAGTAGVVVDRGSAENYEFVFNESTGTFQVGKVSGLQDVTTRKPIGEMVDNKSVIWDSASKSVKTGSVTDTEYTQTQAEDLTSTSARVWTPRRIVNVIAKWWGTIGTAFGKTLLGSTDASAARGSLGLGTAATKDVGTAAGQVPEFVSDGEGLGGFGYGRVGTSAGRYADVNDVPKRTGSYLLTDGHPNSTNNKAPLAGFYDTSILRTSGQSTNDFVDLYLPYPNYSPGMVIAPHTSSGYAAQRIVSDSVNIRTSTGNSTIYPMTQKAVTEALEGKEASFNKNTAFNKNFGTAAGTVTQGNDSRLSKATTSSDGIMSKEDKSKLDLLADQSLYFDPEVSWFTYDRATDTYLDTSQVKATSIHKGMRRCLVLDDGTINYFLDPNNSALKEDGTPSILTGADGQVMVTVPRFYCSRTVKGTVETWIMSAYPRRGLQLHPAFVVNGSETDILYGAYPAVVQTGDGSLTDGLNLDNNDARISIGTDKLASLKGSYAMVGLTRSNFRILAGNRGASWTLVDWFSWQAVAFLLYTEYGNLNSQTAAGAGNVSRSYPTTSSVQTDSPHTITGVSDAYGNSTASAGEPNPFMSYRGIEHFYGNNWQFVDGVNVQDYNVYVTTDPNKFSDDYTTMERLAGSLPIPSASNSYTSKLQTLATPVMLPESVEGNSGQYVGDAMWSASGARVVSLGGAADFGLSAGASCFHATHAASRRLRTVGSRIMRRNYMPLLLE